MNIMKIKENLESNKGKLIHFKYNGARNQIEEFDCNLIGTGVLIDNVESSEKIVDNYISLIKYYGIDNNGMAILKPSII